MCVCVHASMSLNQNQPNIKTSDYSNQVLRFLSHLLTNCGFALEGTVENCQEMGLNVPKLFLELFFKGSKSMQSHSFL